MTFNELMADLGKRLELENFQPDEDGLCELYTDDFTVTFQDVPEMGMVLTTGFLCELGSEPSAKFYRRLLEANFMYTETHGATISVDPSNDSVMLSRYDRLNQLDADVFFHTTELFMVAMNEWRKRFGAGATVVEERLDEKSAEATEDPSSVMRV